MICSHEFSYWVTDVWEDDYGNEHHDNQLVSESYYEDIDLHRYQCTKCKEIFYYSQAAKEYHEDGILSNVKGLDR